MPVCAMILSEAIAMSLAKGQPSTGMTQSEHTETAILPAMKEKLFKEMFERHFHKLYVHAYGWVRDPETSDDIVQDAFCQLWSHFADYLEKNHDEDSADETMELTADRLLPYLYTIVRSKSLDCLRHRHASDHYIEQQRNEQALGDAAKVNGDVHIDANANPFRYDDDYQDYEERLRRVNRLIGELPPQTRRVFLECVVNHRNHREVADELGISPLTVKTLISRAYKTIRSNAELFILFLSI